MRAAAKAWRRTLARLSGWAACALLAACATGIRQTHPEAGAEPVVAMQNPLLTPRNGGLLANIASLQPGDIILSSGKSLSSVGVRLFTTAPVSHASLYVGEGEIIEAVGSGIRRRDLAEALTEDDVAVAFRHPALVPAQAQKIREFADAQVGKKYNHLGIVLHAPFAIERRLCELPGIPSLVRNFCLRGVAMIQLGAVSNESFFCSQFVLEAYRVAGLPITDADPRWISPADILHMREGDVSSVRVNQPLAYIGHLKFRDELALNTP